MNRGIKDGVRSVLKGRALTMEKLLPRLERNLQMMVGRRRLYAALASMKLDGEVDTAGRGDERVYVLVGGR